jgi:hypothetical protein
VILSLIAKGVMEVPIIWGQLALLGGIVAIFGIFKYFTGKM